MTEVAGDWIKIEHVTPDKPEVYLMAEALGIDPDAIVGKLVRLWVWADQQTSDGNAPSVTRALINRVTCNDGFASALENAGWLIVTKSGVVLPNFDRHNLETAKTRALTQKRVARLRLRNSNEPSVTKTLPEKRREEINNSPVETDRAGNGKSTWITPYCEAWLAAYGGEMPIAPSLRPLAKLRQRYGDEEPLARWRKYLATVDPQFASAARFASSWKKWTPQPASRGFVC